MIIDLSMVSIFVRPGVTDMRKQINGLSVLPECKVQDLDLEQLEISVYQIEKNIRKNRDKTNSLLKKLF